MQLFWIFVAGLAGTSAMIGIMSLIHRMGWANADMIRAIGSIYTRSYELSFWPGLITHYCAGTVFALAYALLVGLAPVSSTDGIIFVGLGVGLFHGMVVGITLAVAVSEHHPVEQFRQAGLGVVLSHIVGHVFYGFAVGLVLGLSHTKLAVLGDQFQRGIFDSFQDPVIFAALWLVLFGVPALLVGYVFYAAFTANIRAEAKEAEHGDHGKSRHAA